MPVKKKAITKKVIKKTTKVNTKKKVEVKKKSAAKKKQPVKKIPKKKVAKKRTLKKVAKKIVIPKAPKIKKVIVPQEFKSGENVVYPTHGVGRILTIEKFQYDLLEEQLYVIQFFQDKLTICLLYTSPSPRD